MDIETLRLEREEKRRQRRERIRRILEDDPTSTSRTREETDSSRTTRSTATSRRPRENITPSTTSERTRYSHRDHGDTSEVSSTRSTRTSRLRENTTATPSTRSQAHTSEETTTRTTTTTRRLREDRTSTPSERTTTRSERTTRSNHISEGSPTRSTRTTRTSRQTTDTTTDETAVDSIRARREARRRRNLEHDSRQNKITVENGEVDKATKSDTGDRRRIARNKKVAGDSDLPVDKHAKADDSNVTEKSRDEEDKQASKDTGNNVGASGDLGRVEDSSLEENKSQVKEDTTDKSMTEESQGTTKDDLKGEIKLTGIEKLDELAMVQGLAVADKDNAEVEAKMSEASSEDASSQNTSGKDERPRSVESDGFDNSRTTGLSVTGGEKQNEVLGEKDTEEIKQVVEIENDSEVKGIEDTVDKKGKEDEESPKTGGMQDNEPIGTGEKFEVTTIADELPKTKEGSEILDMCTTKDRQTSDMPASDENDIEAKVVEQTLENSPLESVPDETTSTKEIADADNGSAGDGTSAPDKELVILEELPEMPLVLEGEIIDKSSIPTDGKANENELTKDEASFASEEVATQLESAVDGVTQSSEKVPDDISHEVIDEQKTVSPHTSPRKSKLKTKSDEADTKSSKTRTKSNISRTDRGESETKNERLRAKSDIRRTKSSEVGTKDREGETNKTKSSAKSDLSRTKITESGTKATESETKTDKVSTKRDVARTKSAESAGKASEDGPKTNEVGAKTSRVGKLKVSDDAWKKNVRKKGGVPDVDRAVELTVLGRTGKIKDKTKGCETRDIESVEQWKREVKKGPRKHKSFDEETEKELRELSSKRELKNVVQSCEEKDKESADTWKREVKKNARKHKSLDEDTENELREISKSSILKSRIKECEEKDKERADAWKKEVKEGSKPKDPDAEMGVSEDLKEFSGSGRLKDLISSCAERDENKDKSWESAKQKVKSADEEAELQELASLTEPKTKIIQQYEEMDKQSGESGKKKIKSGEGAKSFDETTDEELKELAKTVDVKTRIQSTLEEQEKPKEKQNDQLEDEELKEIYLKGRLEVFKQESEKHAAENKARKSPSKTSKSDSGRTSPSKAETSGRKSPNKGRTSPTKGDSGRTSPTKGDSGRTSPTKGDSGRISPIKDRPRSSGGRVSPSKDKARTSSTIGDSSGRVSPTKDRSRTLDDKSGQTGTSKDKGRTSSTIGDSSGRVSPTKDRSGTKRDSGRTSPTKDSTQTGRTSPTKRDTAAGRILPSKNETPSTKRDTKGRISPTRDNNTPAKSKLDSIRANLMDGGKNKPKSKRESLDRVKKNTSIKDKIAACKERDKVVPRTITLPTAPSKSKAKTEPDKNTLNAGSVNEEAGKSGENGEPVPVNREGEQFTTIEEEIPGASIKDALSFWKEPGAENKSEVPDEEAVDVDIKGKMTYWESPKDGEDTTTGRNSPPKDSERPPLVILGSIKQGWPKRNRKLNVSEFIKELLSSNCKRRDLKDIQDVKSETKKYLAGGMHAEETETSASEKTDVKDEEKVIKDEIELENRKNTKKDAGEITDKKADDEFSFDDVVNPDEVKQLRDFSNFRRQVRPTNRRAAKSNPVRKLQQRDDLKTGTEAFNDVDVDDEDEEDAPLKLTAIGRLGRAIEPGDRKSKDNNKFAIDALAGLAAKEDVSKITLKKTSKSKTGVSQEKSEHDGTAPVMLLQIKGHRHMQTRLVEPSVESLNSADSFLLVTDKYIHVWNGKDSSVMKKSKASELSNKILQYKLLNCNATVVTIIKDGGVNVETGLTRTFWDTLGGKKTVKGSKETPKDGDYEKAVVSSNVVYSVDTSTEPATLHKMSELCAKIPKINMLDSDKAFVFDFGTEVYAWLGRTCDKATRNKAVDLALEVHKSPFEVHNSLNPITPNMSKDDDEHRQLKRPSWALFGRMTERAETILFEQKFLDWPDVATKTKMDKEKDILNKNLSKGYAKRMAKVEKSEYQAVELVPYDGAKMGEEPPPVKLILEGVNVGRGRGSYDEMEKRSLTVTTNSVTVYHSSEKESRQLEEKEWGHFYSAESYVIRWSYSVKASGIRSLKGGESKRDTTGRDQIAYFFWHGRDCSASGKGTSALATIELDSDKSPQIMVDEGHESACFLNMFDGQMIVHHGKPDEAKSIEEDNVLMYCVHHEDEREISLTQIEARSSNLRSRSSFVVVVIDEAVGICAWHGAKSTKEKKQGALRGAKRLASWFQGIFEINKVDMVEVEEGHEGSLFWEALDGKNDYGSLQEVSGKCDNRIRLFTFLSTEGPFLAREILNPTRGEHVSPYPFRQANLYDATQPALFLVDAVHEMYLWQGWWPGNPEESESATTTGSAEFRWHRDRKLAMQSVQSYADSVGRQMSKAYVVNAGLEPIEFRALFPFWEDHPDVTKISLESGKVDGKKESMTELLAKLSRDRYTFAELLVRPLPEGVDPLKMEMYLSDEEFKEVFNMTKDEFNKLPKWKKLEQRKKAGLF